MPKPYDRKLDTHGVSIDNLIKILEQAKADSPLGGKTAVCICLPGFEYQAVRRVHNDRDANGCVTLLRLGHKTEKALDLEIKDFSKVFVRY